MPLNLQRNRESPRLVQARAVPQFTCGISAVGVSGNYGRKLAAIRHSIQTRLKAENAGIPAGQLEFRIGVNLGDVIVDGERSLTAMASTSLRAGELDSMRT